MNNRRLLVLLAFVAFISLGLPDGLLGVAYPSIRRSFNQPVDALGAYVIMAMTGYLLSSFNSGVLVRWLGVGRLLALSCLLTGAALIGYTLVPNWTLLVGLAFFSGLGAGAIDAGLNTYSALYFSHRVMFWLHAFFGVGTTLGPIIMTTGLQMTATWRTGYLVVGFFQILLAGSFALTAPWWTVTETSENQRQDVIVPQWETLKMPMAWLGILFFFCYTGAEIGIGTWSYTLLTEARGVEAELAGFVVTLYWGAFTVGRIVAGFISHYLGEKGLLRLSLGLMLAGVGLIWLEPTLELALLGLPMVGFAFAPIFPAMVSNTVGRMGEFHTPNAIGFQVSAAALGGSILQNVIGQAARQIGLESIAWCFVAFAVVIALLYEAIQYLTLVRHAQMAQNKVTT